MPSKADKPSGGIKRVRKASPKKRTSRSTGVSRAEEPDREVVEKRAPLSPPPPRTGGFFSMTTIRQEEINTFLRQLVMMLSSGTPLVKALRTLGERCTRRGIRELILDIVQYVESGNALWQAFERHPRHFDTVFINLVKSSEASGTLVPTLTRQVEYWERSEMLKKRVRRALMYPFILVFFCGLVVLVIGKVLVPQFQDVFNQFGEDIPEMTQKYFTVMTTITSTWFIITGVVILVGLGVLYKVLMQNRMVRLRVDRLKLRIPKLGPAIIQKTAVVQMTRSLGLLLRSGLSMMVTLDLTRAAIHNQAVASILNGLRDSVERGAGIEEPLRQARKVIPPIVTDMLVTGEESGQLDDICQHIAESYEQEVTIALDGLGEMIQPVLTLVIGAFVALTAVAVFLPMIAMVQTVTGS